MRKALARRQRRGAGDQPVDVADVRGAAGAVGVERGVVAGDVPAQLRLALDDALDRRRREGGLDLQQDGGAADVRALGGSPGREHQPRRPGDPGQLTAHDGERLSGRAATVAAGAARASTRATRNRPRARHRGLPGMACAGGRGRRSVANGWGARPASARCAGARPRARRGGDASSWPGSPSKPNRRTARVPCQNTRCMANGSAARRSSTRRTSSPAKRPTARRRAAARPAHAAGKPSVERPAVRDAGAEDRAAVDAAARPVPSPPAPASRGGQRGPHRRLRLVAIEKPGGSKSSRMSSSRAGRRASRRPQVRAASPASRRDRGQRGSPMEEPPCSPPGNARARVRSSSSGPSITASKPGCIDARGSRARGRPRRRAGRAPPAPGACAQPGREPACRSDARATPRTDPPRAGAARSRPVQAGPAVAAAHDAKRPAHGDGPFAWTALRFSCSVLQAVDVLEALRGERERVERPRRRILLDDVLVDLPL